MNCDPQSLASASACFDLCVSAGNAGPLKSYLWCQIANTKKFGGGGGGPTFKFTTPTGFVVNSNILGTLLLSSWTIPPPAGVTGTEVWTSPDGTNYTLFSTVLNPPGTQNFAALAVGNFQWTKIRWTDGAGGFSDFTAPIQWSGQAMDWAQRVNTNAGQLDTANRILFVNNLWCAIFNGGIASQILCLNPIGTVFSAGQAALNAAATPLIKGAGSDPWFTQGFGNISVTVNGMACGVGNFFNTGFLLTSYASDNNVGFCVYDATGTNEATLYATGVSNAVDSAAALSVNGAGGNTTGYAISLTNLVTTPSPGAGFYGVHRVAANDLRVFWGNSTNAPAQIGATQAGANGTRFAQAFMFGCLNNNGAQALMTSHFLSFWCATNGLSLAQFTTLFNAVQAYRVAMGGGFA